MFIVSETHIEVTAFYLFISVGAPKLFFSCQIEVYTMLSKEKSAKILKAVGDLSANKTWALMERCTLSEAKKRSTHGVEDKWKLYPLLEEAWFC